MSSRIQRSSLFKNVISAIAKLLLSAGVRVNEFYKDLKIELVQQAQHKGFKTASEIAIQTGIDRRQVSQLLKGEDSLYVKPNKIELIIKALYHTIYKFYPNNKIPLKGELSFHSICTQHSNGTFTATAVLKELESMGVVKVYSDHLRLSERAMHSQEKEYLSINQEIMIESLVSNIIDTNNNYTSLSDSYWTTKISPARIEDVQFEITKKIELFQYDVQDIIANNEANVAENTFPKYGLSVFDYKI